MKLSKMRKVLVNEEVSRKAIALQTILKQGDKRIGWEDTSITTSQDFT